MAPLRILSATALLASALAACTTTVGTTGGGGTVSVGSGTENQLRTSVARELRWYGISDACIQSLDKAALGQVRAFTAGRSPRVGTQASLRERQQVRTFVSRYCPDL